MARRNHPKHPRKINPTDCYDMDYVNLPEHPYIARIVARSLKTIYVNLDADHNADYTHIAHGVNDPILAMVEERL